MTNLPDLKPAVVLQAHKVPDGMVSKKDKLACPVG